MLTGAMNNKDFWCLDESDMVYWYTNNTSLQKLNSPFESKRYIDSGANKLLGPVCLGFWRG